MIATRVDKDGCCYPSYTRLARDTGLSVRTVQRALKEIPSDELRVVERGCTQRDGERRSTKYKVIIPDHSRSYAGRNHDPNNDCSQADSGTMVNFSSDPGQNGCYDRSQFDHLTEQAEQNKEQKRLTDQDVAARNGSSASSAPLTPRKKASVLSHKRRAEARESVEQLPWYLSQDDLEYLQERFHRLGDVRNHLRDAADKCAEKYPKGGPMKFKFFKAYLANLEKDLDPPGLEEGRRMKMEESKGSSAINQMIQPLVSSVKPDYQSGSNIPVPQILPQPSVLRGNHPQAAAALDPYASLRSWKAKCSELAGGFEEIFTQLKSDQTDWDFRQSRVFEKRCGELYHQHLRRPRVA